ncbi:MAG: hypothetical protein M1355_03855 [Patescibacteria group bacterium]|nr:hypothetical protein [Patescibacteria group bacterium]
MNNMKIGLKEILDKRFFEEIPNQGFSNSKKVFVLFSTIPGSGYEKIAKKIAEKYKGLLIDKDKARTIIYQNEKIENTKQPEDILDEYGEDLIKKLTALPNKLIVWMSGADRRFKTYEKWAEEYGYETFVINCEIEKDKIIENIESERDRETAKWFMNQLDRWEKDHKNYLEQGNVDITIKNPEDLDELFEKLDRILA